MLGKVPLRHFPLESASVVYEQVFRPSVRPSSCVHASVRPCALCSFCPFGERRDGLRMERKELSCFTLLQSEGGRSVVRVVGGYQRSAMWAKVRPSMAMANKTIV